MPADRLPRRRGARGFTLLEVMVVLLIMGLLLSLVLARGPVHSPSLALQGAAGDVVQSLRKARAQAIATDAPVAFAIDQAGRRFGPAGAANTLPAGMTMTLIGQDPAGIIFEPDGSATNGAIAVVAGRLTMVLMVNWLTGQVTTGGIIHK